jgi:UDPglucose 6-dehydrogenase
MHILITGAAGFVGYHLSDKLLARGDTVRAADAVILMTEWNQYRGLDLDKLKSMMRGNVFVDLRNVYEREPMQAHGVSFSCVGR